MVKNPIRMLEVESITDLVDLMSTLHNQVIEQLNKLNMSQPPTQVNTVQQNEAWCKTYGASDPSLELCGENQDSINLY